MITQSCLFQRIKKFDGKKIVSQVFSEVAKELGVREAFDKLVPDELWDKRVEMMCGPDWMLLLCKLESKISDDGWQMLLNRSTLGKSGVSCRGLINLIGGGGSGGQDPARVGGSRVTEARGERAGKVGNWRTFFSIYLIIKLWHVVSSGEVYIYFLIFFSKLMD